MSDDDNQETIETEERIIRLTGEINEENAEKFVVALHDLAATPGTIHVIISSEGGSPEEGFRILDAMAIAKMKQCPIHTIAAGKVYSMGAIVFCAGSERTVYRHARIMIHPAYYEAGESGATTRCEAKNMMEELDYYNGVFKRLLDSIGVPENIAERMMREDVYLGAGQAIEYGIANDYEADII